MTSLKKKAVGGVIWSGVDKSSTMLIQFVFGIVLARLLLPEDYGLIGMITIFITVSQAIVESGFSRALIQKKEANQIDYSTTFFFNFLISICIYGILYIVAPFIAGFYEEPLLIDLIKVVGLNVIVSSFAIIQRTILIKKINFKAQAIVNITSGLIGAFVGIGCALSGLGVWSLVLQYLSRNFATSVLFWIFNDWRPSFIFSINALKKLFNFGSKILASTLLYAAFQNIYLVVIGKIYKSEELGYYTRATLFKQIPATLVTTIMQNVTFPILVDVIEDDERVRKIMKRSVRLTSFLLFPMITILIAFANPLVLVLLTEKWLPTVVLLQILAIGVIFFPINAINSNFINAKGRSDLFLKLEIINNILIVITLGITYSFGIEIIAVGYVIVSFIGFFTYAYYSGKYIGYSGFKQIIDMLQYAFVSIFLTAGSYFLWSFIEDQLLYLVLGICTVGIGYIVCAHLLKFEEYEEIKSIIRKKIGKAS
ncbi:Membrane protein involved in the export of O-antigen and teichoic acid [Aquimarina amphilecti]|uniref:Membrane protein involved in the export of O-antigen and teichoic acid n=1 Tax=Aquimarina amphilecti TaxID=1038014 RepID=A0A1H7MII3_AQUAM|nr:lipopolysaccharide biosynthesis protein [Aquimarina amphilecti]SEL10964.1 Membrane protein involved in the export of O-antigen and teichoic acid [Aquimarina amphilecti]